MTVILLAAGIALVAVLAISHSRIQRLTDASMATAADAELAKLREDFEALRLEHRELLEDKAYLQFLKANQERERQLLALDLHDLILPNLTSSLFQLEASLDRPHMISECVETSIEMIRTSLQHTRRTMNFLSPCLTQDEGVVAGIQRLTEQFESSIESIVFRHDIEFDRLTPLVECVLVQLVRESLDEIRQCPTSDTVVIDLRQQHELLELTITSSGTQPPPAACDTDREARIREFVDFLAGSLERKISPSSDHVLRIEFPLASAMSREKSRAFG
ncbi:sensor histidine kinase [Blastopirellula marina]|uniref:sensor histidine kinase n=1 Tax=Blastopirellula marina TaxID=124 RepID=UPI001304A4D9|nr:histidine kinase [Blastopirellula marina]